MNTGFNKWTGSVCVFIDWRERGREGERERERRRDGEGGR